MTTEKVSDVKLDFEQAKTKHLLFKSKLRSILYGADIDPTPVSSHYECTVGLWIYGHALKEYGHLPEMVELEKVHAQIHTCARHLLQLYGDGNVEEARKGLAEIEEIATNLVSLLTTIEYKIVGVTPDDLSRRLNAVDGNLKELYDLQKANQELDVRIVRQSAELFKAKERFELLANATQDAIWDWDLITDNVWWNEGFKDLFGYKDEDIEPGPESWYKRLHPEDQERIVKSIHKVIDNGGKKWSEEYRFRKSDGTYAIIYDRGYALHDKDGKPYRMLGSMQDITYKKQGELQLKQSEAHFRLLAESMPQKVWTAQPDGQLNYINKLWVDYTGLTVQELKGGEWKRIVHPVDWDETQRLWHKSIKTGCNFEFEHRILRNDGSYRWHLSRGIAHRDEEGRILIWVGTNTDVHDQKTFTEQLEKKIKERTKELQNTNEDLQKSNAELEQFAYVTSHDLQEPLRKIQVFHNLISERHSNTLGIEVKKYFERIGQAANRMSGLITDLLEYSRLSRKISSYEEVDLNTIVKNILVDFDLLIAQKNAVVTFGPLPIIEAIALQMNQLFYNLVGNALKFARKGVNPVVNIQSRKVTPETLAGNFRVNRRVDYYELSISDNGIGFSQEYARQIFTIFQRLNDKSRFEGYGIGLAICQKIVDNHHGLISAEGKEMQGATFRVIVPASQE